MRIASHNVPDINGRNCPEVTVFCAVWHKQANKESLLRSHWENLKRQSIPVEPCYIFDNGDTAPDWLDAPWHGFSEPLTVYEAWAAGAALTRTRYVMNLNMDDRLATDAVEILLTALKRRKAGLVGGEWLVCFDDGFQTEPFGTTSTDGTVFIPDWPPVRAESLRLGSGTGERGTFGPATMWDLDKIGRWYPSYFGNQDPILSIGDALFWEILEQTGHEKARLPLVIGRYYSSPGEQAEFRAHEDHEKLRQFGVNKVSFSQMIPERHIARYERPAAPEAPAFSDPRCQVEAVSQALARQYMAMFGGASRQKAPA